jgi:serine phosphatase RsbU (regulator of sigma subunit)
VKRIKNSIHILMVAFFSILKNNLNLTGRNIFLFLFLFTVLENSSAQKVLKIKSIEQANEQIENYINIYVDTTNALDLSQILNKKEENLFSPLKQFTEKRSSKNTYWLNFSIDNNLEIDYPIGLSFPPLLDHFVDIYIFTDSTIHAQKTGFLIDANKNNEIITFSNIIQIPKAKRAEFYLKIKNIYYESPGFSIRFVNLGKAIKQNSLLMSFDGYAFGMMFLMIMYGLFLFFFKKDKLYLYYSVYIILLAAWYFFITAYGYRLFPELPRKIYPYGNPFIFLGFVFYIQFLRLFISTSQILPRWDKFLKIFQILLAIESIRIPIFLYFFYAVILNMIIQNILGGILLICSIFLVIKLFSLKSKLTNIVAFGSSFLFLGLLLGIILKLSINDNSFISNKLGILAELLVFTYGITFRYALIEAEKQKFKEQLIVQLSENAKLHEKVNRELADKVKERTIEIEEQRDVVISQKNRIEKINTEITDSINYAKYIQSSILPKTEQLESYLGEHFVLYKPKDIVSGDFYWISNIDNKTIIAAVDCTGHGVPGAFMSMLGIALLNEIVNKEYITHPGVILRRLRKEVIHSLQQKGERGEQKDGMDIALCTLDFVNMKLQFAGANNPLYLIRNSNLEKVGVCRCELSRDDRLYEIKGDLMPIGIHDRMDNFTLHEIEIYKGDSFYLFTDGYPDQFGGPNYKKFGYRQFRELLLKSHSKTMPDQKTSLEKVFNEWMGINSQIDDILVVGFRIN